MDSVDAAFVWPHNDKTYFFQGIHYWRYDDHLRRMDPGYPKDASLWKGLPPNLDDAMRWSDGEGASVHGPHSHTHSERERVDQISASWLLSPLPLFLCFLLPLRSVAIHALVFERQDGFCELEKHRKDALMGQE